MLETAGFEEAHVETLQPDPLSSECSAENNRVAAAQRAEAAGYSGRSGLNIICKVVPHCWQ